MAQEHVREWIYGECLNRTLEDLDAFLKGTACFQHWLAYDGDTPFGYLLTSAVTKDGNDEYARFCTGPGEAVTLDALIGDSCYLGKGIAHQMIQEFLLTHYAHVQEILIDPQVNNRRAIRVYEKAGFSMVEQFTPSHSALPHFLMRLNMNDLKRKAGLPVCSYVQHNGLKLWCEAIGEPFNPAVVLISGAGAHARFWSDFFCSILAQGGRFVIRFDHRDSGLSSAVDFERTPYSAADLGADVIAIMDGFGVNKAHVVGHSMGGAIAQLLALFHPGRLHSFTSISAPILGHSASVSEEVMAALLENKPTQNFEESMHGFMRSWEILNGDFSVDEEMAKEYTNELYTRSIHPVGIARNHIRCQSFIQQCALKLSDVPVPGLFLHGEKDSLIPPPSCQLILAPDSLVHAQMIPKMGHMIFHKELQQCIANLLLEHFARSEGAHRRARRLL